MKKKLLCLLLCIVMMATLFVGCTPSENGGGGGGGVSKGGTMEAGYARVDVTPDAANSMPLAGLAARNSEGVLDPLYITCVAMKDGDGNIYLLYHTDFLKAYSVLTLSKKQISKETGVPVENIVVSAPHNHSAPGLDDADSAIIEDYAKTCKAAMIQSAKDAIADLKPAKMYTSSKKCENMTFVRHYLRANGTIHGEGGSRS